MITIISLYQSSSSSEAVAARPLGEIPRKELSLQLSPTNQICLAFLVPGHDDRDDHDDHDDCDDHNDCDDCDDGDDHEHYNGDII